MFVLFITLLVTDAGKTRAQTHLTGNGAFSGLFTSRTTAYHGLFSVAGCFVAPHFTASPTGPLCRNVAQQAVPSGQLALYENTMHQNT